MTTPPDPNARPTTPPPPAGEAQEPVWTYRGYRIRGGEFTTAMVHFFRAEISRSNTWRQRLDTTTNWAVVATAATMSYAFSQLDAHHAAILLNALLVLIFLYIEARRYRYYELWSYRVRLMETDFFAAMLVPPFQPSPDWAESLAENLLHPRYPISMLEAIGRRLRRNYYALFLLLYLAWLGKLWLLPTPITTLPELIERAALGPVSGYAVLVGATVFNLSLLLLALLTIGMHQSTGEVLPFFAGDITDDTEQRDGVTTARITEAWFRQSKKRRQLLAFIITDYGEAVAKNIMQQLKRGVTMVNGTGMYTGKPHNVLMCAVTITEIHNLKSAALAADPNAFVITTNASEILGRGFAPFQETRKKSR
ncbi:MAG: DUF2270 domain-containing protein [Anaerolineales bacterium]